MSSDSLSIEEVEYKDSILSRMKLGLIYPASKTEGSWSMDILETVANELARIHEMELSNILSRSHIRTATGIDLDNVCSDYGIYRNQATNAKVLLLISGTPGAKITTDMIAFADDIAFQIKTEKQIGDNGTASVDAECVIAGEIGNVLENTILEFAEDYTGIYSVTNLIHAEGGFEEETDDNFRARVLKEVGNPSTSGNAAEYEKWALSVTGVYRARVFPLARGNGTVDIVLIADNNMEAPQALIDAVKSKIENSKPIGAETLVFSAEKVFIQVRAKVTILKDYTTEMIQSELLNYLTEYFTSLAFKGTSKSEQGKLVYTNDKVSYLKISELIFKCAGVNDVLEYTLNGMKDSIELDERQFPVIRIVEVVENDSQ